MVGAQVLQVIPSAAPSPAPPTPAPLQVLRAPAVQLLETNPHERAPGTGATKWGGGHLDVQITRSGWDATPRREMLAIWLWCNGVPENRGAM